MQQRSWLLSCVLIPFALLGCETQPLTIRPALQGEPVLLNQASRVIQCPVEGDPRVSSDVVAYRFYAIDAMTATLKSHPSLAAFAGINSVDTCEEALVYARAYDQYSEVNPDFRDRLDPLLAAGPSASDKGPDSASLVPRKFIANGTRDTYYDWDSKRPSPIVSIIPVYWLANYSTDVFKTKINGIEYTVNEFCQPIWGCTATFINKHNLLTAAHCMQNTGLFPVSTNPNDKTKHPVYPYCLASGQPERNPGQIPKKVGLSSWLIFWPSQLTPAQAADAQSKQPVRPPLLPLPYGVGSYPYNSKYPYTYLPMKMTGVTAYQHPDPGYTVQLGTADPTDVAILSLDPSSGVDAYLPPDMIGNGGLAYIKASTGADPEPSENDSFYIAGYGKVPAGSGVTEDQLNWTKAPASLKWKYGILDTIASGTVQYSDGHGAACRGDSGGPLYKNAAAAGKPPKVVQYGVTSFAWAVEDDDGCPKAGGTQSFVRLERDNKRINWINETLGKPVFVQKNGTPKTIAKCKPATIADAADPTASEVYQCWGEPCGGPAPLTCPNNKVCVGSALDLPLNAECRVCPDGTCNCILGQCMEVAPN